MWEAEEAAIGMEKDSIDHALLLDFYGELLTEKQRKYWDLHWNEDYSLAEIAELDGLSRQGVWSILRRAEANLMEMEEKTGLIRRFLDRRTEIQKIREELSARLPDNEDSRRLLAKLDGLI